MDSGKLVLDLAGHSQWVRRVKFSPDGGALLSTSSGSVARIWDAQSSESRRAARARRLEIEDAAKALLEAKLGRDLEEIATLDSLEGEIDGLAKAHSELARAARAVVHQARGDRLLQYLAFRMQRGASESLARSAQCYLDALERVEPLGAEASRLGAIAQCTLGNFDAAQAKLEEAFAGDLDAAALDPLWSRIQEAVNRAEAPPLELGPGRLRAVR